MWATKKILFYEDSMDSQYKFILLLQNIFNKNNFKNKINNHIQILISNEKSTFHISLIYLRKLSQQFLNTNNKTLNKTPYKIWEFKKRSKKSKTKWLAPKKIKQPKAIWAYSKRVSQNSKVSCSNLQKEVEVKAKAST